ncbi:MAG TPA: P22 phage major capsid protein family protein [Methanothrix sp.]|nr:P22 phage major capsid protein family protein [Methanothrix sp.]
MSLQNFIPTIWSAKLIEELQKALVYGGCCNRDYEGEIKQAGDRVRIGGLSAVTIRNYTRNTDIEDPEDVIAATAELVVDQEKYYNFAVDDVDAAQAKPTVMSAAMKNAAYELADTIDQYVRDILIAGVSEDNLLGSDDSDIVPNSTAGTCVYDYILEIGEKLSDSKVPRQGRWIVIPPWWTTKLLADARFTAAPATSTDALVNGFIGRIGGFNVYESHNVSNTAGDHYKVLAGTNAACTLAIQINKTEGYRPPKRFADAVKGLSIYGAKVTRPACLGLITTAKK